MLPGRHHSSDDRQLPAGEKVAATQHSIPPRLTFHYRATILGYRWATGVMPAAHKSLILFDY